MSLGHAAPVRLHQAGFSSKAIQDLHEHMVGLTMTMLSHPSLTLLPTWWCIATQIGVRLAHRLRRWQPGTGKTH